MELSKRLRAVADLVTAGYQVAISERIMRTYRFFWQRQEKQIMR